MYRFTFGMAFAVLFPLAAHSHDLGIVGTSTLSVEETCDEEADLQRYKDDELSETRDSEVLPHSLKVTHFCADSADVDAAFDWLRRAEEQFVALFGSGIKEKDGASKTIHIVVGNGNRLCRHFGYAGCHDIGWGRAYRTCRTSEDTPTMPRKCEIGVAFMDEDPDESGWFRNIVHEHGHLLDYAYVRRDGHFYQWDASLTRWWYEGMPEYLQMSLRESMGLAHNPDRERIYRGRNLTGPAGTGSGRSLISTIVMQSGTNDYLSGRAMVRYLHTHDPAALTKAVKLMRASVWRDEGAMLRWWKLMHKIQRKHSAAYRDWNRELGVDLGEL